MIFRKTLATTFALVMLATSASAQGMSPPTSAWNLPPTAESGLASAFKCVGRQVNVSGGPNVLLVVDGFEDGTVKKGEGGGPLNDANDFVMQEALTNFGTPKIMVTRTESLERALKRLQSDPTRIVIAVEGKFNAYDQRTTDRSKSFNFFLFAANAQYARDRSQNALHLTALLTQDGVSVPDSGFSFKAILQNEGVRYSYGIYADDADLSATFARASFQGVGDMERLLIDLAALTVVQKIYGVDVARCLPGGANDRLSQMLETDQSGVVRQWQEGGDTISVQITRTYENWRQLGRPCRAYVTTTFGATGRRSREGFACRVAPGVWSATNPQ